MFTVACTVFFSQFSGVNMRRLMHNLDGAFNSLLVTPLEDGSSITCTFV